MTRARLHNAGGGTHHLLPGKLVFSLVFLLGCQLHQHSLMLAVGLLSLPGTLSSPGTLCSTWLNLYLVNFVSANFYLLPSGHSSPFHCCHVKG